MQDFLVRVASKGPLSVDELTRAEVLAAKCAQRKSFPEDYEALLKNLPLPPRSKLLAFAPYIDENGLACVGRRLCKAPLPEKNRHPVILDPRNDITSGCAALSPPIAMRRRCAGVEQSQTALLGP